MMNMKIRMSFDTIRASIISTHLRTQPVENWAVPPAKASGANTAVTTISSFRIISAAHTITTEISTRMDSSSIPAGLVMAPSTPPPSRWSPSCCMD